MLLDYSDSSLEFRQIRNISAPPSRRTGIVIAGGLG